MEELLNYLEMVTDKRQEKKVQHKMSEIIGLVFFAMHANADEWVEIEIFAKEHEGFLRRYFELANGIPSHDTIQRLFAMVSPEFLQGYQTLWNELLNSDEGEKIKKILAIDGKTQRGNGNAKQKANHILSAVDENNIREPPTLATLMPELFMIPSILWDTFRKPTAHRNQTNKLPVTESCPWLFTAFSTSSSVMAAAIVVRTAVRIRMMTIILIYFLTHSPPRA